MYQKQERKIRWRRLKIIVLQKLYKMSIIWCPKCKGFLSYSHILWLIFKIENLSKNSTMKVNYDTSLHMMILLCIMDILKQTFLTGPVIEPYEYHFHPNDYGILQGKWWHFAYQLLGIVMYFHLLYLASVLLTSEIKKK